MVGVGGPLSGCRFGCRFGRGQARQQQRELGLGGGLRPPSDPQPAQGHEGVDHVGAALRGQAALGGVEGRLSP